MAKTFKMITIVGISGDSYEAAIQNAISDVSRSVRNQAWFEVEELRGKIDAGKVVEYQAKISVGFRVEVE